MSRLERQAFLALDQDTRHARPHRTHARNRQTASQLIRRGTSCRPLQGSAARSEVRLLRVVRRRGPHQAARLEEATPDLLLSVAEEMGKISSEVLQPGLNAVGDQQGCQLENGQVRTPKGFAEAWKLLRDGGWMGLTARPEYGGQGLPHTAGNMTAEILQAANLLLDVLRAHPRRLLGARQARHPGTQGQVHPQTGRRHLGRDRVYQTEPQ